MNRRRHQVLLAAMLAVGALWVWANRAPETAGVAAGSGVSLPEAPVAGHPAPGFTLTTLDGSRISLAALRGQPVVLNFWATWCPPCRAELPDLQAAAVREAGQVIIVAVNQGEPVETVQDLAGRLGLSFVIPLDRSGQVSRLYGVRSLPTTFFIDREGVIRGIQVGPLTGATLAQALQALRP